MWRECWAGPREKFTCSVLNSGAWFVSQKAAHRNQIQAYYTPFGLQSNGQTSHSELRTSKPPNANWNFRNGVSTLVDSDWEFHPRPALILHIAVYTRPVHLCILHVAYVGSTSNGIDYRYSVANIFREHFSTTRQPGHRRRHAKLVPWREFGN